MLEGLDLHHGIAIRLLLAVLHQRVCGQVADGLMQGLPVLAGGDTARMGEQSTAFYKGVPQSFPWPTCRVIVDSLQIESRRWDSNP